MSTGVAGRVASAQPSVGGMHEATKGGNFTLWRATVDGWRVTVVERSCTKKRLNRDYVVLNRMQLNAENKRLWGSRAMPRGRTTTTVPTSTTTTTLTPCKKKPSRARLIEQVLRQKNAKKHKIAGTCNGAEPRVETTTASRLETKHQKRKRSHQQQQRGYSSARPFAAACKPKTLAIPTAPYLVVRVLSVLKPVNDVLRFGRRNERRYNLRGTLRHLSNLADLLAGAHEGREA